jgi:glucose-6-phosphate isomerase
MKKNLDSLGEWSRLFALKKHTEGSIFKSYFKNEYFDTTFVHQHLNESIYQQLLKLPSIQGLDYFREQWAQGQYESEVFPRYIFSRPWQAIKHPYHHNALLSHEKMKETVDKIRQGQWLGYSGQPITDIINIGIGGSDLGPRMSAEVLEEFKNTSLRFHFISDADPYAFSKILENLNPETSLFLVSSKSFKTEETLLNAQHASAWIANPEALKHHFIALTSNPQLAIEQGYQHVIAIGDWMIGRYSCFSAMNLSLALMIGYDHFEEFLKGAAVMDQHFLNTPAEENLPIIMALMGIWNINFFDIQSHLLLMYDFRLRHFVDYVQQLDMESNGKSINCSNQAINYATGPIIWGGLGNQAHHSYYQLLAQGKHPLGIDFITVADNDYELINALCRSRINILQDGVASIQSKDLIKPQTSTTHIHLYKLTPGALGALIALYEHKVFTQAWLWNINPFDQPGVESAKRQSQFL